MTQMRAPSTSLPLRTRLAAALGHVASGASRRLGRGDGSVIGGRVLLAVDPGALRRLAGGRPAVLVSGTNGKTTTTRLIAAALATAGPVVSNTRGANMAAGLASALSNDSAGVGVDAVAALEVDEAWLPKVAADLTPRAVVLLNLSRDQLDRNNEVRMLSRSWREAAATWPADTVVVANADDPLTAWAASAARSVVWVAAGLPWTADAAGCPKCGSQIAFADDGREAWRCTSCDFARPAPDVHFTRDELVAADGQSFRWSLSLPGRANRANAAMAVSAAGVLGVGPEDSLRAIAGVADVDSRYRSLDVDGIPVRLLLAKNPAGWLEVLDIISDSTGPLVVGINARIADGRDPSWLWDVPFEALRGRFVVAAGERCRDLAVRLHYAEVEHSLERDERRAIAAVGSALGRVDVVANYTSFMDLTTSLNG